MQHHPGLDGAVVYSSVILAELRTDRWDFAVLSTVNDRDMGQSMGQTGFPLIRKFFSQLFDRQNARKSPEPLRFQDFLWVRRQDSNFSFANHLEYSVRFRVRVGLF